MLTSQLTRCLALLGIQTNSPHFSQVPGGTIRFSRLFLELGATLYSAEFSESLIGDYWSLFKPCPNDPWNKQNIYVTLFASITSESGIKLAKTGGERYFESRAKIGEYRDAYDRARSSIDEVDRIVGAIENKRVSLGMSKAELARRVGIAPESVRRLLSAEHANPTLSTVVSLAKVLDLDIVAIKRRSPKQIA